MTHGLALGIVVENVDPEHQGRVRVRYPWMGDAERTTWVRVAAPGAGNGRGLGLLPTVGDEVVLGVLDGDPEQPVVLGSLWNGVDRAAHAPGQQQWVTPAGNTLVFIDGKAGDKQERVELHTGGGSCWVQLAAKGAGGVPLVTISSGGDIAIEAPNGEVRVTAKSILMHVETNVAREVKGAVTDKIGGALTVRAEGVTLCSGTTMEVMAANNLTAHAGGTFALVGGPIQLNEPGAGDVPQVDPIIPPAAATAWAPTVIPAAGPGRSTQDPVTPTRRVQSAAPAPLTNVAPAAHMGSPSAQWAAVDHAPPAAPMPGPRGQAPLHDIQALLQKSVTGTEALTFLDQQKIGTDFKLGGGSCWDGARIVLDQSESTQGAALALVQLAHHARSSLGGTSGNPLKQMRAEYVSTMVRDVAVGAVKSILTKRELVAGGVPVEATIPLELQFTAAYDATVAGLRADDPRAALGMLAQAGSAAGLARVIQGVNTGEVVTGATGQTYPTYCGGVWDFARLNKL